MSDSERRGSTDPSRRYGDETRAPRRPARDTDRQLTVEDAKTALESHVRTTTWLRRDLAKRLAIESFERSGSFDVRFRSFTESRATERAHEPYRGGAVDGPDNGLAPAPWDIEVQLPGQFIHQDHARPVPHTDEVRTCHGCSGNGDVLCPRCGGRGRVSCSRCGGSGSVSATRTVTRTNSDGQTETTTESYTESCSHCGGDGRVTCSECSGDGRIVCPTCSGATRLKHYVRLLVAWRTIESSKVIEKTDLPDELVSEAAGKLIHQEEDERLEQSAAAGGGGPYRGGGGRVNTEVNEACNTLIASRAHRLPDGTKLHRQSLHVRAVPVYEARYRWGKGTRRFWVFGDDERVHAPEYPLSIVRVGLAIGLPAAIALAGAALFVASQEPPSAPPRSAVPTVQAPAEPGR